MTTAHRTPDWLIKVDGSEHGIPHFHIHCPSGRASVAIANGAVLAGSVPKRVLNEAWTWAEEHAEELLAEWHRLTPNL